MQAIAKEAVASWSLEERLEETFNRTLPKLGPEAQAQLQAAINPTSLAIIGGVLVAWVVSHALGLGQIIDIIIIVGGVIAIGSAVFVGLDYLYDFAIGVYRAKTTSDLDAAADKLAKAISTLGIQAVLAILFRGAKAPRTGRGKHIPIGPPPPRTPGIRYKPTVQKTPNLKAGEGRTSFWGDIRVSTGGSANDRAMALLHERVHQFLTPKLYILREYRINNRAASYVRSSLWRYIEEALAETVARVGILGIRQFFSGIRFPIQNGYMYLRKGGGFNSKFGGSGAIPEAAGLLHRGIVHGIAFELWFSPVKTKDY
ncbi:hypothetical protein [Candidatus Thiosymbion oneisti]|uniref:hypothetical protein n=1 Tax=Candidatus Thiosymbion oneisti TaxID=589554 RepID=UPI00105FB06F|nr:hypothetical protein [Candidatus Thiosymbion oneisti]